MSAPPNNSGPAPAQTHPPAPSPTMSNTSSPDSSSSVNSGLIIALSATLGVFFLVLGILVGRYWSKRKQRRAMGADLHKRASGRGGSGSSSTRHLKSGSESELVTVIVQHEMEEKVPVPKGIYQSDPKMADKEMLAGQAATHLAYSDYSVVDVAGVPGTPSSRTRTPSQHRSETPLQILSVVPQKMNGSEIVRPATTDARGYQTAQRVDLRGIRDSPVALEHQARSASAGPWMEKVESWQEHVSPPLSPSNTTSPSLKPTSSATRKEMKKRKKELKELRRQLEEEQRVEREEKERVELIKSIMLSKVQEPVPEEEMAEWEREIKVQHERAREEEAQRMRELARMYTHLFVC